MPNLSDRYDLKSLIKKQGDKGKAQAAVKIMNDVDHVLRMSEECTAEMAITILQALVRTYEGAAIKTYILKTKPNGQEKILTKPNIKTGKDA